VTQDSGPPASNDATRRLRASGLLPDLDHATLQRLLGELEEVRLPGGAALFSSDPSTDALFVVIEGQLEAWIESDQGDRLVVGRIDPGDTVGEIQLVTGGVRTASVSAVVDSRLLRVGRAVIDRLSRQDPRLLEHLTAVVQRRLRRNQLAAILALHFGSVGEHALASIERDVEWIGLRAGQQLFSEGDPGDGLYVVVSGRLRAFVVGADGAERSVGELVRGDLVGEMTIVTGEPRSAAVRAMRDSQLARWSKDAFERLLREYPSAMLQVTRTLVTRLRRAIHSAPRSATLTNVAVVAASREVDLDGFCRRLAARFAAIDRVRHLSGDRVDAELGAASVSRVADGDTTQAVRLAAWLDEQESRHPYTLYQADHEGSPWTGRCVRRADHVLIVAAAGPATRAGEIRELLKGLETADSTTHRTLVLLHPESTRRPSGTRAWLDALPVEGHLHVRPDREADFERLARFVAGRPTGLVLGGGGARGFAHIGVIQALEELGYPIDFIGGTSMGALIAGEYAMGFDTEAMVAINQELLSSRSYDFTLPLVSLIAARRAAQVFRRHFGDHAIEDLWVQYFAVSANLSTAAPTVHRTGPLRSAIRSSASLPGLVPPVVRDGELLVDGALLDNLPIDVMRGLCRQGPVVAVDVSAEVDMFDNPPFGDSLSGWSVLWGKLNPRSRGASPPSVGAVLMRSTELASVRAQREVISRGAAELYLRPPVDHFGMLDFKQIRAVLDTGYRYARPLIEDWLRQRAAQRPYP
jgi:NTE family protein